MSKRLVRAGSIGCKYKTSSWHLNTVSCVPVFIHVTCVAGFVQTENGAAAYFSLSLEAKVSPEPCRQLQTPTMPDFFL